MANKNLFNSIKLRKPNRNTFDLSHDFKFSCNMGQLIPVMCEEAVPGDRFKIACNNLVRFAPMVAPPMHKFSVFTHYFFVPHRLVWPEFDKWLAAQTTNNVQPAFPYKLIDFSTYSPLADYLGIPNPIATETEKVSAIPFAAYQMIYDQYYRDQNNVPTPINYELVNGNNTTNPDLNLLHRRAWAHDYFTSALPFVQKGAPVELPVTQNFPNVPVKAQQDNPPTGDTLLVWNGTGLPSAAAEQPNVPIGDANSPDVSAVSQLYAETSMLNPSTPTTINDLRTATRLQEWLEICARAGTRLTEIIYGHFGVRSPDARLQRPEYITGTKSDVSISEVLNTTGTATAAQGEMAGHGVSVTSGQYGDYYCQEHGYIIGIMSILPVAAYQQGIPKHFLKYDDPYQLYWPKFAHLGEQPIDNREIYAFQGTSGLDPFGYVPRYSEYKYSPSRVAGDFRTTLDFWHAGRIFPTPPALNADFIEMQSTETDRIFAVTAPDVQKMYCHVYNQIYATRPMPKFGTPSL